MDYRNMSGVDFRDSMNNKGYSSVAVQNVHAMPNLPNNLDGAIDAAQRKLQQTVINSSSKVKSPRTIHHTKSRGGGWVGPFRREFCEQIPENQYFGSAQSYQRRTLFH